MTDTFAKSAIPPSTAIAWCAKDGIYVQFPVKDGAPYVTRFRKTTEGLQQALNILLENPAPIETRSFEKHSAVKRVEPAMQVSDEVHAEAASIVRRLLK